MIHKGKSKGDHPQVEKFLLRGGDNDLAESNMDQDGHTEGKPRSISNGLGLEYDTALQKFREGLCMLFELTLKKVCLSFSDFAFISPRYPADA